MDVDDLESVGSDTSVAAITLQIVNRYAALRGQDYKTIWIDHSPHNIRFAKTLLGEFPDAKIIHLIRDGRAVAASVMPLDWGPNSMYHAARWWMGFIALGLACEASFGDTRIIRVKYEDLLTDTEKTLQTLCAFIGTEYETAMLRGDGFEAPDITRGQHQLVGNPPDPSRALAWSQSLTDRQIEIFESIADDLLDHFGL